MEEPTVPEWVIGVVIFAVLVLFASYIYLDGYTTGRCHDACQGEPSTLGIDGICTCEPNYPGTVP